jgi:uncharacterized protein
MFAGIGKPGESPQTQNVIHRSPSQLKPSQWRRSWAGRYLRHVPRIKQLRGTWLHRRLGDRFLDPHLWRWERKGTAAGLAIGAFFSALPMPLQSLPAALFAFLFRANIPAALVGCWITNPLTFPLFFYLQLKAGSFLLGRPSLVQQFNEQSFFELLKAAPGVLFAGGIVMGLLLAALAYFLVTAGFGLALRTMERSRERRLPPAR